MSSRRKLPMLFTLATLLLAAGVGYAQTDPGPRVCASEPSTTAGCTSGRAVASVTANSPTGILDFFTDGQKRFLDTESVQNSPTNNNGLGPRFNFNQCSGCHSQPAEGGGSPSATLGQKIGANPQSLVFKDPQQGNQVIASSATNTMPAFVTAGGPTREARFPFFFNGDGTANTAAPNGGVEDLFTISGRPDAGNCSLQQPSFAAAAAANNLIFRIPLSVFGDGLVENIADETLLDNHAAQAGNTQGVSGSFNHNGNDGTISRFGWKAQNKSLLLFSGEAYNVEMGVSNELFTQDRPLPGEDQLGTGLPHSAYNNCLINPTPEDTSNPGTSGATVNSDIVAFAEFMRLVDQPTPAPATASSTNGRALFHSIGCALCHTPSMTTQHSSITAGLDNVAANLFSDLEIHHMGTALNDNVSQGGAGGDQFRTTPLWGVGQRIFFLHDGRCSNLSCAIDAHASSGSEASTIEGNYDNLSASQKQDILNFLRSL